MTGTNCAYVAWARCPSSRPGSTASRSQSSTPPRSCLPTMTPSRLRSAGRPRTHRSRGARQRRPLRRCPLGRGGAVPMAEHPHQGVPLRGRGSRTVSLIAVSSFSLHNMLGPLHLEVHDEDGNLTHLEIPKPAVYSLEEFGVLAWERLGVIAIELCQIQFADSSPERVAPLRSSLDRTGVRVLTVVIDIGDLAGATAERRRADVVAITRWLDIARALGAPYARVNIGNPLAGESS